MNSFLILAYLIGIAATFPIVATDDALTHSPFSALSAHVGAIVWPLYWLTRFTSWLAGVAR